MLNTIVINKSVVLPITSGNINVDSTSKSVVITMRSGRLGDILKITKISRDSNLVSLFSDEILINNVDIIIFGLPPYVRINKGKVYSITLRSNGKNWIIIKEE